ncbi:hypothetical protein TCAL_05246 [Tigriopus californicus]|uniref:Ig-like domain-containing protein n=1 Tax=Tigriopus californicus TaxID=6832 RepID=A0A553NPQ5_TIGCA|nr:hypothetical protein TCAL_05246 [Tigriopus californicus]
MRDVSANPAHEWRSGNDLNKLYDSATPNPTGSLSGPWFDMPEHVNITASKSKTTHLVCRIKNLGNQTVSWLRHSDTHLLTTGLYTFTPERRFSAIHRSSSEDWVLEIRNVQLEDQGIYECQVSTTPVRSQLIALHVAEPVITMQGGPELHIKFGSRINISCEISNFPKPITYIVWYKDDKPLLESDRILISLGKSKEEQSTSTSTTTIPVESQSEKFSMPMDGTSSSLSSSSSKVTQILGQNPTSGTEAANNQGQGSNGGRNRSKRKMLVTSSLLVKMARSSDTGNYKCASEAGESKPTSIHVITGETRAGLQVNKAAPRLSGCVLITGVLALIITRCGSNWPRLNDPLFQ